MVSLGQAGESRLKGGSSHTSSSRKRPIYAILTLSGYRWFV